MRGLFLLSSDVGISKFTITYVIRNIPEVGIFDGTRENVTQDGIPVHQQWRNLYITLFISNSGLFVSLNKLEQQFYSAATCRHFCFCLSWIYQPAIAKNANKTKSSKGFLEDLSNFISGSHSTLSRNSQLQIPTKWNFQYNLYYSYIEMWGSMLRDSHYCHGDWWK